MAQMLPPEPHDAVPSEIEVFRAIQAGLSDEWTAIHSLGMTSHPEKPWTEIDFVLVGTAGVFCLEVKGGRTITRRGTRWTYTDGAGRVVTRNESPFDQVGSAAAALRAFLVEADREFSRTTVGYGVATPFVDFTVTGPGIVPELVYDADDHTLEFSAYIGRVVAYWKDRLSDKNPSPLDSGALQKLIHLLAGDFRLTRRLPNRIEDIERQMIRLTEEQQSVIQGIENSRILVRGGAGTGKTMLALQAAVDSARGGEKTLLTCYSRRLGEWLSDQVGDVQGLTVSSLHKYMHGLLQQTDRLSLLPPSDDDHRFQVEYPRHAVEALFELELTGTYDRLIVDESQDLLTPGYLDVFDQLLDGGLRRGKWIFFYDPNQDIFRKLGGEGMARVNGYGPARYRLSINCRNTRQIATAAHLFARIPQTETLEVDGPDIQVLWYKNRTEARRKIDNAIGQLLSQGVAPTRLTVLSALSLEHSVLADGFVTTPYELSDKIPAPSRTIQYATIAGFKGLESDAVTICDINGISEPEDRYLLYVAATRAKAHLQVALPEDFRDSFNEAAREFGEAVQLMHESADPSKPPG